MWMFLLIFGYILICPLAFFGHSLTLCIKIKTGATWKESDYGYSAPRKYKFSFVENILGWGLASLIPVFNIGMVIYDIAYLAAPTVKKIENEINKWILSQ